MDGDRRWPLRHGLIVLALVFFVVYGFVFLRDDRTSDWQNVFVRAALRLQAHEPVLLLPAFILARLAVERRPPWLHGILAALLITGPLTAKGLIGRELGSLTLAWGLPTWFALVSLVSIWGALRAVRPAYR